MYIQLKMATKIKRKVEEKLCLGKDDNKKGTKIRRKVEEKLCLGKDDNKKLFTRLHRAFCCFHHGFGMFD
jgi:hypothetical protein